MKSNPVQFGGGACRFGGSTEGTVFGAILLDLRGTTPKAERLGLRQSNHSTPGQLGHACRGFGARPPIGLGADGRNDSFLYFGGCKMPPELVSGSLKM